MRKEILNIKRDDAIKAYDNAGSKQKKLLIDLFGEKTFQKNILERIKTFNDVLVELGEKDKDVIEYRKLQKVNVAEYILSNQEQILITKVLNEGWLPNWDNGLERKYFPWFDMNNGSSGLSFSCNVYDNWATNSAVGSRLCFKSPKLAKYAGIQFTEIYKKSFIK
jgi:hypothetical protein